MNPRILDLRQPLVPKLSPKRPQPPAPPAAKQPRFRVRPWREVFVSSIRHGLLIGLGFVCLSVPIGLTERIVALYALISVLYRIDSQRTFLIALIFLCLVVAMSALGFTGQAENFAVYAFYFLVIGLGAALWELRDRPKS